MNTSTFRKLLTYIVLLTIGCFLNAPKVSAEGTADMYPSNYKALYGNNAIYRGVLMSGINPTQDGVNTANPFPTYGTMKVYAKQGEHILVASSAMGYGSGKIGWRAPNGASGEFIKTDGTGRIKDRAAELAGPKYGNINNSTANAYTPCVLDVQAGQEGVWEIEFYPTSTSTWYSTTEEGNMKVEDWNQNTTTMKARPYILAFDISVANADATEIIKGRVYTNIFVGAIYNGNNDSKANGWYTKFYVLTQTSYLYEVRPNGQNGHYFSFFANNKGIQIDQEGTKVYKNAISSSITTTPFGGVRKWGSGEESTGNYINNGYVAIYDPRQPDSRKTAVNADGEEYEFYDDVTHKIFFNKPDEMMPASAPCVYGVDPNTKAVDVQQTWLITRENSAGAPELNNLKFIGKESQRPGVFGPEGVNIYFEANMEGYYYIDLEFKDSKYKKRTLDGVCVKGKNVIIWDGKDGGKDGKGADGIEFEGGCEVTLGGKLTSAEIHFPFLDLEYNNNGFYLDQYDENWENIVNTKMYWDDKDIARTAGTGESVLYNGNTNDDGTSNDGIAGPAHNWYSSQRGDLKIIDTWTYASGNSNNATTVNFNKRYIDLAVTNVAIEGSMSTAHVLDTITYILDVSNIKKSSTFNGSTVSVEADADSASVGVWFPEGGFYTTEVELVSSTDPNCKVVKQPSGDEYGLGFINLANNKTARIKVKGYAGVQLAHSTIQPIAFIMRPGDIFEVDCNNVKGDGMPLNPINEYCISTGSTTIIGDYKTNSNNLRLAGKINLLNSAPIAIDDEFISGTGETLSDNVLANDYDIDGDSPLKITKYVISGTTYNVGNTATLTNVGTFSMGADGTFTFVPDADFTSSFNVTYYVSDQYAGGANFAGDLVPGISTANLKIRIGHNRAPKVEPLEVTIKSKKTPVDLGVNIYDLDGDPLTVTLDGENASKYNYATDGRIYYIGGAIANDVKHTLQVKVDDDDIAITKIITVNVEKNSAPTITPDTVYLQVKQKETSYVLVKVTIEDKDKDAISVNAVPQCLSSSGANAGSDGGAFIYRNANLYFEANGRTSKIGTTTYNVVIPVTDSQGISADLEVTVKVEVKGNKEVKSAVISVKGGDFPYGTTLGGAITKSVTSPAGCTGTWVYKDANNVAYSEDEILPVGTYNFTVTFIPSQDNTYGLKENVSKSVNVTITKQKLVFKSGDATKTYDGLSCRNDINPTLVSGSLIGTDRVSFANFAQLINVGTTPNTYDIIAVSGNLANYDITKQTGTLIVNRRNVTAAEMEIILSQDTYTFNNAECKPSVDVKVDGKLVDPSEYKVVYENNINATTAAKVTISDAKTGTGDYASGGNYTLPTKTVNFTINKREVTLDWGTTIFIYDGTTKSVSAICGNLATNAPCTVVTYTGVTSATEPGTYTATAATLSDATNYVLPSAKSTSWTINKRTINASDLTITLSNDNFVYDGTAKVPSSVVVKYGNTVLPSSEYTVNYSNNINAGDNAKVTISNNSTAPHYTISGTSEVYYSIAKKPVTLNWGSSPKTYNTQQQTLECTLPTGAIVSGDVSNCSLSVTGNTGTNVGSYEASASLSGTKSSNYEITNATKSWAIQALTLTASDVSVTLSPTTFTYNGSNQKPTTITLKDTKNNKTIASSEYSISYPTDIKNVGTKTITITDNNGGNYALPQLTSTYSITAKAVTIKSETKSWTYDGASHQATSITTNGFVTGEGVTATGFPTVKDVTAAPVSNTFTYSAISGTSLSNYTITPTYGTLSITANTTTPTITWPTPSYLYDGTEHKMKPTSVKVSSISLVEGTDYTLSYNNSAINAGSVTVTVTAKGNFGFTAQTKTYTIAKRSVTLTSGSKSKTYDGTALTDNSVTVSGDGWSSGEGATYNVKGTQTNVGSSDNSFEYTLTSSTNANNYTITKVLGTLVVSSPSGTQTITLSYTTRQYDGTSSTPTVTVKIGSATVPASEYTATYPTDTKNVGIKTITITNNTGGNYTVSADATTYEITPKQVTLNWSASSFTYDGTEKSVTATCSGLCGTDVCTVTSYENNVKTAVGTYTAKAKALSNSNYALPTTATKSWSINKNSSTPTVTLSATEFTYDKTPKEPTAIVIVGGKTLVQGTDYTISYTTDHTNVGEKSAVITAIGGYSFTAVTKKYSINAKPVTIEWSTPTEFTYDGSSHGVTAKVITGITGETCTPTYSAESVNSATNAGSYTAIVSGLSNANYSLPSNTMQTWQITPKPISDYTITLTGAENCVYNGTAHTPTVAIKIGSISIPTTEYDFNYENNINAGTAKVNITNKANGNYTLTNKSVTFDIAKVNITITSATNTWTYDGNEHKDNNVTITGTFVVGQGVNTYSSWASITEAGTKDNTYSYTLKSNTNANNYNIKQVYGKLTVNPKSIDLSKLQLKLSGVDDCTYDGTEHKPTAVTLYDNSVSPAQIIPSGEYLIEYPADMVNAAENLTVTVTDKANGNYAFTGSVKATYTIKKVAITILSGSATKEYDGTPLKAENFVIKSGAFVSPEGIEVYDYSQITNVGEISNKYSIRVKNAATKLSNYNITLNEGKLTVTPKKITPIVKLADATYTYDGTQQKPIIESISIDGQTSGMSSEYVVEYKSNVAAGTGYVVIKDAAGGNYTFDDVEVPFTIGQREVTINWSTSSFVYDGEVKSVSIASISGIVNADECTVKSTTGTWSATDAGNYTASVTSLTNNNYKLGASKDNNWVIGKKSLSPSDITIVVVDVIYNGLEQEPAVKVMYKGEELNSSEYAPSYENNINYGSATVKIKDSGIGNYNIQDASSNFQIKRAPLTVTSEVKNKSYDGTRNMQVNVTNVAGVQNGESITVTAVGLADSKNAGDKVVTVTYTINGETANNYSVADVTYPAQITKRNVTLVSASASREYNGSALKAESVTEEIEGSIVEGDDFEYTNFSSITNVGHTSNEYTVNAKAGTSLDNYNITKKYGTLEVTAAAAGSVSIIIDPEEYTYTGKAIVPTVKVNVGGTDVPSNANEYVVTYSNNVNVGDATIKVEPGSSHNYGVTSSSRTFKINPAKLTVTGTKVSEKEYDGTTNINVTVGSSISGIQNNEDIKVTATASVADANVGEGKIVLVQYTIVGATKDNYVIDNEEMTVNIKPRPITIKSGDAEKVYDGSPLMNSNVTETLGSFVSGEGFAYSDFVSVTNASVVDNTFTYEALNANTKLTNYKVTVVYGTLTVTRKQITPEGGFIKWLGDQVYTYDKTEHQPQIEVLKDVNDNPISSDEYSISWRDNVNAGTGYVIIDDKSGGNYAIVKNEIPFTINKRILELNWGKTEFTYDSKKHTPELTFGNVVSGDECKLVISSTSGVWEAIVADSYNAIADAIDNENYALPTIGTAKTWSIIAKQITDYDIIISETSLVYNGNKQEPAIVIKDKSGNIIPESEYKVEYSNNINAGTNTAVVTITDSGDGNYKLDTKNGNFSIAKKQLTPSVTSYSKTKTYDGTTDVEAVSKVEGECVAGNSGFVATINYDTKDAKTGKTITATYTITNSNYELAKSTEVLTTEGVIEALQLTAEPNVVMTKVYDGTAVAKVNSVDLVGVLAIDAGNVNVSVVANYASAAVGIKDITVKYTISGSASSNYKAPVNTIINNGEITQPSDILVSELSSISDNTFTYGEARVGVDDLAVTLNTEKTVNYPAGTFTYYVDGVETPKSTLLTATTHEYYVVYTNADGVSITSPTYTIVVNKLKLIPEGTTVKNKTFDNTTNAEIINVGTLTNVVPSTDVNIASATAEFESATSGTTKKVTVNYVLGGADKDNYYIEPFITTANIDPVDNEFNFNTQNGVYGDVIGENIAATNTQAGSNATYTYYNANDHTDITGAILPPGDYTIYVTYSEPGHEDATSQEKSITISPKTITVDINLTKDKVYDGNATAAVSVVNVNGKVKESDELIVTVSAAYDNASIGTDKDITVTYTKEGAQAGYYIVAEHTYDKGAIEQPTVDWTINKVDNAVYGEAIIGETVTGTPDGQGAGNYTYKVDGEIVASPYIIPAGDHTITITYTNTDGVELSTEFDYSVSQKELTISSVVVDSKVYDGNTSATLESVGNLNGALSGDDVNIDAVHTTATFDNPNAGTDKQVTIKYVLNGSDADNYFVADVILNNGIIEKKDLSSDIFDFAGPADPKYDGNGKEATVDPKDGYEEQLGDITVYYSEDGATWTDVKPIEPGDYQVKIVVAESDIYKGGEITNPDWKFTIEKGSRTKPYITTTPTSTPSASDGKMIGLTTEMEISYDGSSWVPVTNAEQGFAAGDYKVRYAETEQYNASEVTNVNISATPKKTPSADDFNFEGPSDPKYDGNGKEAKVEPKPEIEGIGDTEVQYRKEPDGEWTKEKPVEPGTYEVKVIVEETDKYEGGEITDPDWKFDIEKVELTSDIFNFDGPAEPKYDGKEKGATVEPKSEYEGKVGDVTVYYSEDGSTWTNVKPTEPGEYKVKIQVTEGNVYKGGELTDPDWKFVVEKGDQPAPSGLTTEPTSTPTSADGKINGLTVKMEISSDGGATWTPVNPTQGYSAGEYKVRYAENEYYKASEPTTVVVASNAKKTPSADDFNFEEPSNPVYDGDGKEAKVEPKPEIEGIGDTEVQYRKEPDGEWTKEKPVEPGTYEVKVIVTETEEYEGGEVTSPDWKFDIEKAELTTDIFNFDGPAEPKYDGKEKGATVEPKSEYEGKVGDVTVYYSEDGKTWTNVKPTEPGEYKVKIQVTEGNVYKGGELTDPDWKFVVEKGDQSAPSGLTTEPTSTPTSADGKINGITDKMEISSDGGATWTPVDPTQGYSAGEYKVRYAENENYKASEPTIVVVASNAKKTPSADDFNFEEPSNPVYDGNGKEAKVEPKPEIKGMGEAEVQYRKEPDGTWTTDKPVTPGVYDVKVIVAETENYEGGEVTSPDWKFEIQKGELISDIFDFKAPANLIYDRNEKEASVNVKSAYQDKVGEIEKIMYSSDEGATWSEEKPIKPNAYQVKILVSEGELYNGGEVTSEAWTFEILPNYDFLDIDNDFAVNVDGYCPMTVGTVGFEVITGSPNEYRAIIEGVDGTDITKAEYKQLKKLDSFEIKIPDCDAGKYVIKVQFRNAKGLVSDVYSFDVMINLSERYMTAIWSDVVSIINKVDLNTPDNMEKRFKEYQWYCDGVELSGATKPYYCQKGGLDGTYYVKVVTMNDESLRTCAHYYNEVDNHVSVNVYPNPVVSSATVKLSKDNGQVHEMEVRNYNGVVFERSTFEGKSTSIDLSNMTVGYYVVSVDGIIVKVIKK